MPRVRMLAIAAAACVALTACGTSNTAKGASGTAGTTTTPSTAADGMTAEEMAHMKPAAVLPHALALKADGTIDAAKVDLGGVPGVTAAEQKRAEALLRETIEVLPHWNDVATAAKEGFHSIGDGLTGDEHWIRWDWIDDNTYLNPHKPEALVYHVDPSGTHTLEAVMFLLPKKFTFDNLPDVGGKLVQFHIHDNLCFTNSKTAPQVAGITSDNGACPAPLVAFHPNVMMHVWIRPNPCGPFAALNGLGAGQVKPGQTKACDQMHGDSL